MSACQRDDGGDTGTTDGPEAIDRRTVGHTGFAILSPEPSCPMLLLLQAQAVGETGRDRDGPGQADPDPLVAVGRRADGWPYVLSDLESLLETGERKSPAAVIAPVTAPGMCRRAGPTNYTPCDERFGLPVVTGSTQPAPVFSLSVEAGVVQLRWAPGVHITGLLAAEAMATVDQLNGDRKRPLLVDMTGTATLDRAARKAFGADCQVSRMAIVGSSPVDKVIANFALRVSTIDIPSRFFTSVPAGLAWLRNHEAMA